MKLLGQVEPISLVIVTGIVVSLVGVAYMWGIPLIQKRSSQTEYQTMERFIQDVQDAVSEIARSGSGEKTINIPKGSLKLVPFGSTETDNNRLLLEFAVDQPLIFRGAEIYLGITSFEEIGRTGTYGESSPSVVKMTQDALGTQYGINVEIWYRELEKAAAPKKGYVIQLCRINDDSCTDDLASGTSQIRFSYGGIDEDSGAAENGGDLVKTRINVELL